MLDFQRGGRTALVGSVSSGASDCHNAIHTMYDQVVADLMLLHDDWHIDVSIRPV